MHARRSHLLYASKTHQFPTVSQVELHVSHQTILNNPDKVQMERPVIAVVEGTEAAVVLVEAVPGEAAVPEEAAVVEDGNKSDSI